MNHNTEIKKLLEKSKSNSGFTVPKQYFEQMQTQVTAKLDSETKVVPIAKGPGRYAAIGLVAAAFAVVFILLNNSEFKQDNMPLNFADISSDTLGEYMAENLDETEWLAFANESDFNFTSSNKNIFSSIESSNIGDFLMNEMDEEDFFEN